MYKQKVILVIKKKVDKDLFKAIIKQNLFGQNIFAEWSVLIVPIHFTCSAFYVS